MGCCLPTGEWSQDLVLVPAYWQAELGPGVWLQGPGVPELVLDHCWRCQFLTHLGTGFGVSWSLCCLAGVQARSTGCGIVIFLCLVSAPCQMRLVHNSIPGGQGQGPEDLGAGTCPLVGGSGSWAFCWAGLCLEVAVGSWGLEATCLLMGWAVSPPSLLLGLRHSNTDTYRLLGQGNTGSWG